MIGPRVAVAPGRHAVRVASTTGGTPRLLAELPARAAVHLDVDLGVDPDGDPGGSGARVDPARDDRVRSCRAVLRRIVGPDVAEVVVVHPPGRPPASVQAWLDAATAVAPRFRRVAAPVAAGGGHTRAGGARRRAVGRRGHAAAGGPDRRAPIVRGRRRPARPRRPGAPARGVGRRTPDGCARRSRCCPRPATDLCGSTAEQVRAALTPLLDEAVAALAAVVAVGGRAGPRAAHGRRGALSAAGRTRRRRGVRRRRAGGPAAPTSPPCSARWPWARRHPPSRRARPSRPRPGICPRSRRSAASAAGEARRSPRCWSAALAGAGTAVAVPMHGAAWSPHRLPGVLVQYGYRLDVPAGWEHTGGLPERRRSLLTRVGAPQGTDLIAVERTPLGYDAAAEPERAAAEMRAAFDQSVAAGARLSDYGSGRGRRAFRHDVPAAGARRRRRRVVRRARRRRPAVRRVQAHPGRVRTRCGRRARSSCGSIRRA